MGEGAKGRSDLHRGGGQEDGITMKGAQSKVKWGGGNGGAHGVNGGHGPQAPPPHTVTPLLLFRSLDRVAAFSISLFLFLICHLPFVYVSFLTGFSNSHIDNKSEVW